jgi:hypothetical protein
VREDSFFFSTVARVGLAYIGLNILLSCCAMD